MNENFIRHTFVMLMIGFVFGIPSTLLSQETKEDEVRKRIQEFEDDSPSSSKIVRGLIDDRNKENYKN